jgi:phosphatidylserine/phosphatidylglycerophosphate/cardiolipin synthase-like enzyme
MRTTHSVQGLTARAIAGTHTVLLGFDLDDPAQCLGFGIHRTDTTEHEAYWLRGMKTFPSVVPIPVPGMDFSLGDHPVQGFQWGDYSAKPLHDYTYRIVAFGGAPGALTSLTEVALDVRTEAEDDGTHGVWFNRGVAGSQAFVKKFGQYTPPPASDETHPAFAWLSRGLGEAFLGFVGRAASSDWGLRGAFYEFTWRRALDAFEDATIAGADVSLVVHGRDKDSATGADKDHTAEDNRAAVTASGLDGTVIWRTAANKSALQHNKFLVLTHQGSPVAVWTGSTNLTQGAIYGHLNVGHVITDPAVAQRFLDYWEELADQSNTTAGMRLWTESSNPVDLASPPPPGLTTILSPRATDSTLLDWYAEIFDAATNSSHITGAFGLNEVFRRTFAVDEDLVRTVLLDQRPPVDAGIPTVDPDVRIAWGDYLHHTALDIWAQERLTDFNSWVKFIHTKIILVDPLLEAPTIITGSANYSDNSTTDNEENTVIIRGDTPEVRRVADIYLTEYQRLFTHFVFRDWVDRDAIETNSGAWTGRLLEDPSWSDPYYVAGGWRARQRQTFAGSPVL